MSTAVAAGTDLTVSEVASVVIGAAGYAPSTVLRPLRLPIIVQDASTKFVLLGPTGQPVSCIIAGRGAAGRLVVGGACSSAAARDTLPVECSGAVLAPRRWVDQGDLAVAEYDWCQPIPDGIMGRFYWPRVRRFALAWLRAVAGASRADATAQASFRAAIRVVLDCAGLSDDVRRDAEVALRRIDDGSWRPRHQFDHNDFWRGNILIRRGKYRLAPEFAIIDWAGANMDGYGMYDLCRAAASFGIGMASLSREVQWHCQAKGQPTRDAMGDLLAAVGHLLANPGCVPPDRCRLIAERNHGMLARALRKGVNVDGQDAA